MSVLGTAGHVDHGKTTLVRWLTGIDTDRLPEEKERGITIELGFAHLDLGGHRLGLVDVPGHERFVRAMAAGAAGIDLALLVVAADEGVMPQTREHVAICSLLGVRDGVVVLTKVDLVEPEWLELVREDVARAMAGTFLDGAPIVAFSAVDPVRGAQGIAELKQALQALLERQRDAAAAAPAAALPRATLTLPSLFRLPIDRVFTMHGFGTVVTGTCFSGQLEEGEQVEVLPSGCRARVRGLQAHGRAVTRVEAGQRVALNLQGMERSAIERGETVIRAGELRASSMLDARIELLAHLEQPLGMESHLLLHHGAAQVEAALLLLDRDELWPGGSALAQLRLSHPLVALPGDRFLLRGFVRHERHGTTVGGGQVLVAQAQRHRRKERAQAATRLHEVEQGGPGALAGEVLRQAGPAGMSLAELALRLGCSPSAAAGLCAPLLGSGRVVGEMEGGAALIHAEVLERLAPRVEELLRTFHASHPRRSGLEREELLSRLPELAGAARSGRLLLQQLVEQGLLARQGQLVRLAGFVPQRDEASERRKQELLRELRRASLAPPHGEELARTLGCLPTEVEELLAELVEEGLVVRVREDFHLAAEALADLQQRLVGHLTEHGEISPGEFKQLVGASRRFAIPLAEHFDRCRITLRVGEMRRLRTTR